MEVFSGSSRVTACLKQLGLKSSFGVDKIRVKHAMSTVVTADLTTPEGEQLLMNWLSMPNVVGIFLAPPCGSASRARQIPLKRKFGATKKGPRLLRTDVFPNGIPNMNPSELSRVSLANKLYYLTAKLVKWAVEQGCIFVVENPQFSLFWATSFWTEVAHLAMYSVFHSCQYGSKRKKKTMLAFNSPEFAVISARCPGQSAKHKHAQWGINSQNGFATAEETAYPMGLARLIAVVFVRILLKHGISPLPDSLEQVQQCSLQSLQRMRASTGQQSRSSRIPPLVPTYKNRFKLKGPKSKLPAFKILQRTKEDVTLANNPLQLLPKGSRLLALEHVSSSDQRGEQSEEDDVAVDSSVFEGKFLEICSLQNDNSDGTEDEQVQVWGMPWSPEEFVEKAVKAGHPSMLRSFLPPMLDDCIHKTLKMPCHKRINTRAESLKFWMRRSLQLREEEKLFHESLDPTVGEVISDKKILLWKEMLESIQYGDMGVVDEFCNGTLLTGPTEVTGLWPKRLAPATLTETDLENQARMQRAGMTYGQVVFFDNDIARAVWDQSLGEVERGELEGPFSLDQVPPEFTLSRRFGVVQNDKVRCVDDFSWSGVNSASQPQESPKPHTLDVVAGMVCSVMDKGPYSDSWVARSFDLKSAYKQCAVHPTSKKFSHIVVGDPNTSTLKAFRSKALPFGSVKSVHAFLRVSHSLWAILTALFGVISTNYFDDFVAIAAEPEATSVTHTVQSVFRLLGWRFAADGPKAPPFGPVVVALGVSLDVSKLSQGLVLVDNTKSRREELAQALLEIIEKRMLRRLDALKLRGRMQFASGQLYGRISKRCLACVTQHAYGSESSTVDAPTANAFARFRTMLLADEPRTLSAKLSCCWYVFTDASFEPESEPPFSGIGAVLVDNNGDKRRFFSEQLSEQLITVVNVTNRKTLIFEFEFFAILCALNAWKDWLHQTNVVIHTDNDAVRDCFISCHTTSENTLPILDACLELENVLQCNTWITRVPTESNVADDPSRLVVQQLIDAGCVRDKISCNEVWSTVVKPLDKIEKGEAIDQHACPFLSKEKCAAFKSRVISEELK